MNTIKPISLLVSLLSMTTTHASVETYFSQIKTNPNALYQFLKQMPKGGELHYHLAGGSYAETMLKIAAEGDYCLNKESQSIQKDTGNCDGITAKDLHNDPVLYDKTVRAWSMKDFVPGIESGHDHFFNSFYKFFPLFGETQPELIADVVERAANQHEHYMELMIMPDNGTSIGFSELIAKAPTFEQKRQILLADKDYQKNIDQAVGESERLLQEARNKLNCDKNPQAKGCEVTVKFQSYTLREQSLDKVFAQALQTFESVARSQKNGGSLVAVNLVQAEDGIISLQDYHQQMQVYQYLHQLYPEVNIALHAGELTGGLVPPKDLQDHIHEALMTAQAQRIGHGVDIAYEKEANATLEYMANQHKAVEINLISNLHILNLSGNQHPLNYYLANHVPVVLSTDDEGILRTDLTSQYVEAVSGHGLDYPTLKQINRNALTYSFASGKSIWADATQAHFVPECQDLNSAQCQDFIKNNEKARLQWKLEQDLNQFEKAY